MPHRKGWTLTLVCVAIFMLVLDVTVVAVALSDIQRDLTASLGELQWVVDAYTLPLAALLLPMASLGDRFGRAPLFAAGLTVFTLSSAACALAPTALALVAARAAQGLGGAVLFGVAVPLLADVYPAGRGRDMALGVFGAFSGAAVAVGPLAGGVLTEWSGWRAIFWLNVPIGVLALGVSAFVLTGRRDRNRGRSNGGVLGVPGVRGLDWLGMPLCATWLFLLVLGCIEGSNWGWTNPRTVAVLAGAVLCCALFVVVELRVPAPMVDIRLFRVPHYAAGAGVGFVLQATLVASTTYLSLYVQNVLGYGALDTGLRFLPLSLAAFAAAALIAPLLRRVGAVWLVTGTALGAAAGLELIALGPASPYTTLLPGLVVCGCALGVGTTVLNRVAVTDIAEDQLGAASGAAAALRQAGVTVGVAALGSVYHDVTRDRVLPELGALDDTTATRVADAVASGAGTRAAETIPPGPLHDHVTDAAAHATVQGLDHALHSGAGVAVAMAALALFLLRPGAPTGEAATRTNPKGRTTARSRVP